MTTVPYTPQFSVGTRDGDAWVWHSDHTAREDALATAARLRQEGADAHAFDWHGPEPDGTLLDPTEPAARALSIDPDCRAGKHRACGGSAWDHNNDHIVDCECDCHTNHENGSAQ